ncbi:rabenosyn-5 [Microdochium nivale]|nr:rabenosyn-5 [Microdochium nivale]
MLTPHNCNIANNAFLSAKCMLEARQTLGRGHQPFVSGTVSIEDVQNTIQQAISAYEARIESSGKIRKWLHRTSEIICHYGTVLDVFVQHHPEYVSLVWGTMKFLFVSVLNHGQTLKLLAKSITEVAQRLPNIRKLSTLHPSNEMKVAIETLYSHILKFFVKAYEWLTESKLKHVIHSLTQPPQLIYGDILSDIIESSSRITDLANIESQLEIRIMHEDHSQRMRDINTMVKTADLARRDEVGLLEQSLSRLQTSQQRQEKQIARVIMMLTGTGNTVDKVLTQVETFHALQTSAELDTNRHLTQLEQLHVLSNMSLAHEDPDKCFQHHSLLRRRRARANGGRSAVDDIWSSPKLYRSANSASSTLTTIRGPFSTRWAIQDFGVDLIRLLSATSSEAAITLWVLTSQTRLEQQGPSWTSVDLLKYLTWQAMRAIAATTTSTKGAYQSEKDMSMKCSQFYTTRTEQDWIGLFAETISNIRQQTVFAVIDLAAVKSHWDNVAVYDGRTRQTFDLIAALSGLAKKTIRPKLKIILLIYEASWSGQVQGSAAESIVQVKMGKTKLTATNNRAAQFGKFKKTMNTHGPR